MNNTTLVKFDSKENQFIFFNESKILLGSFTIHQLLKYVIGDISKKFLKTTEYTSATDIIEKYICTVTNTQIKLLNHLESPFMGNIDMLIKLQNALNSFDLKIELEKEDDINIQNTIKEKLNYFVYLFLNHTLKLIVNISDMIKNDDSKKTLKDSLLKYTIYIINKINHYIKDSIDAKTIEYNQMEQQLEKIKQENSKMNTIHNIIDTQNNQITRILAFIHNNSGVTYNEQSFLPEQQNGSISNNSQMNAINASFKDSDYAYTETG
jgi:hypothetical protein